MPFAVPSQARAAGQHGQVSDATKSAAASPLRWLLADECSENQPRMNWACW
jgi:hypothetical protein